MCVSVREVLGGGRESSFSIYEGREGGREGDNKENPDTFNAFLAELDRDIEVRLVFNYKSDEVQSTPAITAAPLPVGRIYSFK